MSARRRSRQQADIHEVFSNLGEAPRVPDLSHSIMGRLGYRRVSRKIAMQRRVMAWANRVGIVMVAGVALAIGWRIFEASPQVRRPADTTVPDAIRRDVQIQQQRLEGAIRGIRIISTPRPMPNRHVDPSAERDNEPVQPAPEPRELQDDVNRSSMAPVRWV
jgi:hypothetical protein